MDRTDRLFVGAVAALAAVLGAAAALMSYGAISATAVDLGVVDVGLRWAPAVAIDGIMLAGSFVAWAEARHGKWHLFPVTTVAVFAALSIAANVAHVGDRGVLAWVLAASAPVAYLVTIELAAWLIRRRIMGISRAPVDTAQAVDNGVDDVDAAPSASARPLITTGAAPASRPAQSSNGDRYAHVWDTLEQLDPAPSSVRDAAERTSLTRHTITQAQRADLQRWATLIGA